MLNEQQNLRYSRQLVLQAMGTEGQNKLLASKVLVIGAGGLGSPISLYLAAAGVGTIGLVDADVVEISNLQRQILHFTPDVNTPKVTSAHEKLSRLNPDVNVIPLHLRFTADNADDIIKDYDFVIDATDNFATKFLINDACVKAAKSFSHGGVIRMGGQTLTYLPGMACFRCVFDDEPPANTIQSNAQAGILGAVAGTIGTIQATEAIKFLLGKGNLLTNRLLVYDAYEMTFNTVQLTHNPDCMACGNKA